MLKKQDMDIQKKKKVFPRVKNWSEEYQLEVTTKRATQHRTSLAEVGREFQGHWKENKWEIFLETPEQMQRHEWT